MKKLVTYYAFIIFTFLTIAGFLAARTQTDLILAFLIFPLFLYFGWQVWPSKKSAYNPRMPESPFLPITSGIYPEDHFIPMTFDENDEPLEGDTQMLEDKPIKAKKLGFDLDRRNFLKLVGSGGVTLFLFSLFTKDAEAAFFGSVPGPGTVKLKDIAGNQINPAEKYPTSGYNIAKIDDSSPAYYGFENKDEDWYIMNETVVVNVSTYGYRKRLGGEDDLTTEWVNRGGFTYSDFNDIFN